MVVDFFVPDVTNSSVVDIVRGSAGTTFNIEHLGCGCDVKALHDDEVLFKKWRSVCTLRFAPWTPLSVAATASWCVCSRNSDNVPNVPLPYTYHCV